MRRLIAGAWSLVRRRVHGTIDRASKRTSKVVDADQLQAPRPANEPFRVLFVSHSAGLAGAERCMLGLLGHLDRARITPLVLLPERGPMEYELEKLGVSYCVVHYDWWLAQRNGLPLFGWRVLRSLMSFPRLLLVSRRLSPDLIYTNSLVIPQGAIIAAALRKAHIWHIRELVSGNETLRGPLPLSFILRTTVRLSSRVIAISEGVRAQYPSDIRENVHTIYDGVDLSLASDTTPDDRSAANAIELAVIGTLSESKGQLVALETVRRLREVYPAISLSIVGTGKPAFRRRLSAYVEEHDLSAHVKLIGHRRDITPVLQATDILLMPSRAEAFGLITVEALGAGVPVVGTDAGGTTEILSRGGGVLVPPDRPDLMAEAIHDLLRSPERIEACRRQARRTAAHFSAARNAELVQREMLHVIAGTP